MPETRPPDAPYGKAAFIGCDDGYASGLYELSQLTTPVFGPERTRFPAPIRPAILEDLAPLLEEADFVVLDPKCAARKAAMVSSAGFVVGASRKQINPGRKTKLQLYVRRQRLERTESARGGRE